MNRFEIGKADYAEIDMLEVMVFGIAGNHQTN
jgi:hypothetical protein